jgi:hypothetical protein
MEPVRSLAQADPLPNITANLARHLTDAKKHRDHLVTALRDIDKCKVSLLEHGVDIDVDLGPIGNAAAAARRDLEKERPAGFSLPRAS